MEKTIEKPIEESIWNDTARLGMRRMKEWLKQEGPNIRTHKLGYKNKQRQGEDTWKDQSLLWAMSDIYRHKHIAYSELRGRLRDQIEKPGPGNEPNEKQIKDIKEAILTNTLK